MKNRLGRTQVAKYYSELNGEQLRVNFPSQVPTVSATNSKSMAKLLKPSDMSEERSKWCCVGACGKARKRIRLILLLFMVLKL